MNYFKANKFYVESSIKFFNVKLNEFFNGVKLNLTSFWKMDLSIFSYFDLIYN